MKDMSYLKDYPIAVLGGGAVCKTVGADSILAGNKVRICDLPPFSKTTLANLDKTGTIIQEGGQISRFGFTRSGTAHYDLITEDVAECVKGCKLVIIGVPSIVHSVFFAKLIPALEDGMIIHIIPDNYGSLRLRKMMREAGCDKKVIIGGWSSAPFGTRVVSEGGVPTPAMYIVYRAITLRGAALPSTDQEKFLESVKYIGGFDSITQGEGAIGGDTVMDVGFSNFNPVLHCPGTILGVGAMENYGVVFGEDKKKFSIFCHAFCKSIAEVQYAFYQEECRLAEAMGVGIQPFDKDVFFQRTSVLGPEFMGEGVHVPFDEQWPTSLGTGPFTVMSRHITEDVPVGCHVYHELGKKFGVETKIIDSMITLGSVMTGVDFYKTGLTLRDLGIAHMTREQLLKYLNKGVYTAE